MAVFNKEHLAELLNTSFAPLSDDIFEESVEGANEANRRQNENRQEFEGQRNQNQQTRQRTSESIDSATEAISAAQEALVPYNEAKEKVGIVQADQNFDSAEDVRTTMTELDGRIGLVNSHVDRIDREIEANYNLSQGLNPDGSERNPLLKIADLFTGKRQANYQAYQQNTQLRSNLVGQKATLTQLQYATPELYEKLAALPTEEMTDAQKEMTQRMTEVSNTEAGEKRAIQMSALLAEQSNLGKDALNEIVQNAEMNASDAQHYRQMIQFGLQGQQLIAQQHQMAQGASAEENRQAAMEHMRPYLESVSDQYNVDLDINGLLEGFFGNPDYQNTLAAGGDWVQIAANNMNRGGLQAGAIQDLSDLSPALIASILNDVDQGGGAAENLSMGSRQLYIEAERMYNDMVEQNSANPNAEIPSFEEWRSNPQNVRLYQEAAVQFVRDASQNPSYIAGEAGLEMDGSAFYVPGPDTPYSTRNPREAVALGEGFENAWADAQTNSEPSPRTQGEAASRGLSNWLDNSGITEQAQQIQENNPDMPAYEVIDRVIQEKISDSADLAQDIAAAYSHNAKKVSSVWGSPINQWPANSKHGGLLGSGFNYDMMNPVEVESFLLMEIPKLIRRKSGQFGLDRGRPTPRTDTTMDFGGSSYDMTERNNARRNR